MKTYRQEQNFENTDFKKIFKWDKNPQMTDKNRKKKINNKYEKHLTIAINRKNIHLAYTRL